MHYKSKETNYNGVINYIYKYHSDLIPKSKDFSKIQSAIKTICRDYLLNRSIKFKKVEIINLVQKNWVDFKNYLKNKTL